MRFVFLGLALSLLVSCGSVHRVVVLQNPHTLQTVECRVDPWGSINRHAQINACVWAYEEAGYKVVGDVQ